MFEEEAIEIARMIRDVSTDDRGDLFLAIADQLKAEGQYFTGKVIENAANIYGLNPKLRIPKEDI